MYQIEGIARLKLSNLLFYILSTEYRIICYDLTSDLGPSIGRIAQLSVILVV